LRLRPPKHLLQGLILGLRIVNVQTLLSCLYFNIIRLREQK
jgi:hypothetical protein